MDLRIRIRIKMSRIRNTNKKILVSSSEHSGQMENVRQAGLLVKSLAGVLQSTVQYELLRSRTQESQVGVIPACWSRAWKEFSSPPSSTSYCAPVPRSHR
jgi:hypothetical protein